MRQQDTKIKLSIPTIDFAILKKMKGGYILYGGELDASYCETDGPADSYPTVEDDWNPSFNFADPEDFVDYDLSKDDEDNEDIDSRDDRNNTLGGSEIDIDNLPLDTLLTEKLVSQILNGKGIDYIFSQEILSELSRGQETNACVRYAGELLPDGTVLENHTIIIGNNADLNTLQHELFHVWQGTHLYIGDGIASTATSAMEFMRCTLEYIDELQMGHFLYGGALDTLPTEFLYLLQDCVTADVDKEEYSFDWQMFFDNWNRDYFEQWDSLHASDGNGRGYDDGFVWDWVAAHEWWEENHR